MSTIEILTKPSCTNCVATYRALDSKKINYNLTDMSEHPDRLAQAKELGYLQAPIVLIHDDEGNIVEHWSGFRPDKIMELANSHALVN